MIYSYQIIKFDLCCGLLSINSAPVYLHPSRSFGIGEKRLTFIAYPYKVRRMSAIQRNTILVYNDTGCADINQLVSALKSHFVPRGCRVTPVNAQEIICEKKLNETVLAFFMPGGADTPYRQKLAVRGNALIRDYVQNGGIYYGICAGAYYACRETIFEADIPALKIMHKGGLDLVEGKAIGTLYKELQIAPYAKTGNASAVVNLIWQDGQQYVAHYHGGPYFQFPDSAEVNVLANYDLKDPKPAIVARQYGDGKVIISGVHFEDSGEALLAVLNKMNLQVSHDARCVAHHLCSAEKARRALCCRLLDLTKE